MVRYAGTEDRLRKGSIVLADLDPAVGSEQAKTRPVVVFQHDSLVKYANTVVVVPISSVIPDYDYPFHVKFKANQLGLKKDGVIKTEHIRSIDKSRIHKVIGQAPKETLDKMLLALLHLTDSI